MESDGKSKWEAKTPALLWLMHDLARAGRDGCPEWRPWSPEIKDGICAHYGNRTGKCWINENLICPWRGRGKDGLPYVAQKID